MNNAALKLNPVQAESRIITFPAACKYLGVKRATLYNWVSDGKIPAFKVEGSRVWKFDKHDLDVWISQQKERGANDY